ncbi:hypothetical protein KDA14_00935, partial [Candidatus Saccharibacteria bacterium]|nr:hypothetical protein [Candidatus Saccharibacteria bacterium]
MFDLWYGAEYTTEPIDDEWKNEARSWWKQSGGYVKRILSSLLLFVVIVIVLAIIISLPWRGFLHALGLFNYSSKIGEYEVIDPYSGQWRHVHKFNPTAASVKYFENVRDIDHLFQCECTYIQRAALNDQYVMLTPAEAVADILIHVYVPIRNILTVQETILLNDPSGVDYVVPKMWSFDATITGVCGDVGDGGDCNIQADQSPARFDGLTVEQLRAMAETARERGTFLDHELFVLYHFNPCIVSIRDIDRSVRSFINPSIPEVQNDMNAPGTKILRGTETISMFGFLRAGSQQLGGSPGDDPHTFSVKRLRDIYMRFDDPHAHMRRSLELFTHDLGLSIPLQRAIQLLHDGYMGHIKRLYYTIREKQRASTPKTEFNEAEMPPGTLPFGTSDPLGGPPADYNLVRSSGPRMLKTPPPTDGDAGQVAGPLFKHMKYGFRDRIQIIDGEELLVLVNGEPVKDTIIVGYTIVDSAGSVIEEVDYDESEYEV